MNDILWKRSLTPVPYEDALSFMDNHVIQMLKGEAQECVWFLEHDPLYTLGTGTQEGDVLNDPTIPILKTNRGGRSTYHGPGQRVVYVMLNLKKRNPDLKHFVWSLEEWLIQALAYFKVIGFRSSGRVGIWVNHPIKGECKIAAIGLRVRRWITFHGISLNISPNLDHYQGIIPCGLEGYGVTSLQDLKLETDFSALDAILQETFLRILLPCLSSHQKN